MRLPGVLTALICVGLPGLWAQPGPGNAPAFVCTAGIAAGGPLTARLEGITEQVGDLLIQCTGGKPTALGDPVPLANFQLFLNTAITSRNIGANGANVSEAELIVDEPKNPLATIPPLPFSVPGTGDGKVYTGEIIHAIPTSSTVYYGNVFQARQAGANSLAWEGVPIDAPGTTGVRVFRITNVRANVGLLPLSGSPIPTQVVGFVKITGNSFPGGEVTITNREQVLAEIILGLLDRTFGPDGKSTAQLNVAECLIPGFNPGGASSNTLAPAGVLDFREGFNGVFRGLGPFSPITGVAPFAETSPSYNPNIRQINTAGDATKAGLADFGTRLRATFNNVPAGTQFFVSVQQGVNSTQGLSARLVDNNTGAPITGLANGYSPVSVSNGTGIATWEILKTNPGLNGQPEDAFFNYTYVNANCNGTQATCPTGANTSVNLSFAPAPSASTTKGFDPLQAIPRFIQTNPTSASNNSLATFAVNRCFPFTPSLVTFGVQPNGQIGPLTSVLFPYISGSNVPGRIYSTNFGLGLDTGPAGAQDTGVTVSDPTIQYLGTGNGGANQPESSADNSGRAATPTSWLTATLTSNATPLTVKLTADPAGLPVGTYKAQVSLTAKGVTVSPFLFPVTLDVQASRPVLKLAGVQHAATYVSGSVAPGEVTTFFGELFGPDTIAVASANVDTFPATVGNTQVLFDGVPAPMIYAAKNQVSAMAPFALSGKTSTQVQIVYNGVKSDPVTVPVVAALPGLFSLDSSGGGQGAIFNQDGTLNTFANPAPAGTIVVLYGTGAGQTNPPGRDGKLALTTFPTPLQPVTVFFDGTQGDVLYGAQAPTLIEGVLQVNVRIPATVKPSPGVPIVVKVGNLQSPPWATVAVGPAK